MRGRKILLLVDNFYGHLALEMKNGQVHLLPPNTTSYLQPLDAGIIRSFKAHYKKHFFQWLVDQIGAKGVLQIDLLSSIQFVIQAWDEVSGNTFSNCWCSTKIMSAPVMAQIKSENDPKEGKHLEDLEALIEKLDPLTHSRLMIIPIKHSMMKNLNIPTAARMKMMKKAMRKKIFL